MDLGTPTSFLGIQIETGDDYVKIHQRRYIEEILKQFGMSDAAGVSTPMVPNSKLSKSNGDEEFPLEKDGIIAYQSVVGSLIYAIVCTRPDLAFTLSRLSKFNANPTNIHMAAAYHALRYFRQTSTVGIVYRRTENSELYAFSDSDFAADPIDRKSTSGFVTIHNGGATSWRSKQQDVVALSTTEAEYIGLSDACRELNWLVPLAQNSGMFKPTESYVPTIYGDNQGSIALATNPIHHNRSKHIDVKFYHYVRNEVENGRVKLKYIPTAEMTADILTKALPQELHQRHMKAMGMD